MAQAELIRMLDKMAELLPSLDTHAGELLVRSYADLAAKLDADCKRLNAEAEVRKQQQAAKQEERAGQVGTEPPRKALRR